MGAPIRLSPFPTFGLEKLAPRTDRHLVQHQDHLQDHLLLVALEARSRPAWACAHLIQKRSRLACRNAKNAVAQMLWCERRLPPEGFRTPRSCEKYLSSYI